jgi:hypothetical protein
MPIPKRIFSHTKCLKKKFHPTSIHKKVIPFAYTPTKIHQPIKIEKPSMFEPEEKLAIAFHAVPGIIMAIAIAGLVYDKK